MAFFHDAILLTYTKLESRGILLAVLWPHYGCVWRFTMNLILSTALLCGEFAAQSKALHIYVPDGMGQVKFLWGNGNLPDFSSKFHIGLFEKC